MFGPELPFAVRHAHSRSAERNAFSFQAEPLLKTRFAGQRDAASSCNHSMPWQSSRLA